MALLGPSGCGKSTTLRIVAGLEVPDQGRVLLDDRDITQVPANRRGFGLVFQNYALFPHMTVGENVSFGLRMLGVDRAETERRTREALDLVQLMGLDDRYPAMLSGGQQQRVALARTLIMRPSALLLDEPLGALDKNLRENMQFELRRLQRALGITTILVTHDQEEALTLSDIVVVMNQGRIVQSGTPKEIYDRPRTRFVAEFLGSANIFECTVDGEGKTAQLATADGEAIVISIAGAPQRQGRVLLAVRPERVRCISQRRHPARPRSKAPCAAMSFAAINTSLKCRCRDLRLRSIRKSSITAWRPRQMSATRFICPGRRTAASC